MAELVRLPSAKFVREQRDLGDLDCSEFDTSHGPAGDRTCDTDGHYRCKECRFFNAESPLITGDWGRTKGGV